MLPVTIDITSLAYGGKGIGRIGGKVVFVPYTAPGDRVRVDITYEKKRFLEGRLLEVVIPSPLRQSPPCPLFGRCGGCNWQHISYPAQLDWKQRIFCEILERIGGIKAVPMEPSIPAVVPLRYRAKAQFHVEEEIWGFFEAGSHKVVEVEECHLLDPILNMAFISLRDYMRNNASDLPIHTVEIGKSDLDGRAAALIHLKEKRGFNPEGVLDAISQLKGIEVRVTPPGKRNGKPVSSAGDRSLIYRLGSLTLKAHISTFSQVNISQNLHLIDTVLEYADINIKDYILDLYCGAGNLTLPLAGRCSKVTGVDNDPSAIEDAISNKEANSISNVDFICQDALKSLKALGEIHPGIVILDPPREGGFEAIKGIVDLKPKKVVYVSCNPSTLARDLSALTKNGYMVKRARLIDMFPQTYHIEGLVELQL